MTDRAGLDYPRLLSPGRIGTMELRNRIVSCPMGDRLANDDGSVSDAHLAYFEARARGGAALVLLGSVAVTYPQGAYALEQMAIAHEDHIPGYAALAQRVHAHGAKVAAQLVHNAGTAINDMVAGRPMIVPSIPEAKPRDRISQMVTPAEVAAMSRSRMSPTFAVHYQVATEDDCASIIDWFATAAERCARAGLDGVELHAGHGYLFDEFLSPASNTRTDRWGGPIENRARLLCETVREIRRRMGADFPLWARINAFEAHRAGGTTIDDAIAAAQLAVDAGLDAIHVSAYGDASLGISVTDSHTPHRPGALVASAAAVKRAVSVPVITFGRLEPAAAESALARGDADFVAMGRKLLADPDLPNKLRAGHEDDIRPCIYQYRCIGNISVGKGVRCVVNPATGRENEVSSASVASPRRVLIVGGGPAGLEAARLLAHDGHEVTLWEARSTLGGQLDIAARVDEPLGRLRDWLVRQVRGSRVDIRLGMTATVDAVRGGDFDTVVVATGATRPLDGLPDSAVAVDDLGSWLTDGGDQVGRRVVILGGDRGALAVARRCVDHGRDVSVFEPSTVFAVDMGMPGRFRSVFDTEQAGVTLVAEASTATIAEQLADTVIVAGPAQPRRELLDELARAGLDVRAVGDCEGDRPEGTAGVEAAFASVARLVQALRE
ncbi:MAG: NAD(P)-binding protein [Acidimicrobiales bacterium]